MLEQLDAAAQRAAQFIISEQAENGAIGPDISYSYKAVWPLAITGHFVEAVRLLKWMEERFYRRGEGFCVAGEVYAPNQLNWRFLYPNAWITIGAHHLEHFETSLDTADYIFGHQGKNGGFPAARVDTPGASATIPQDMLSACIVGLLALYLGKVDVAQKAAKFLEDLYEAQPDPSRLIYLNMSEAQGLLTDYPPERIYMYVIQKDKPEQPYFAPGAVMAFLSKLYMVTGIPEYLSYAEKYYELALSPWSDIPLGLFDYPTSGKIGWGAANLYRASGKAKYKAVAERVGRYLLSTQLKNGAWPKFRDNSDSNLAAEFCAWLVEMAKYLA